jgi:HAMP domain-containing protein
MKIESRLTEADWADFRRRRIADDLALGMPPDKAKAAAAAAERQTRARLAWLRGRFERMAELWDMLGDYWHAMAQAHPEIDLEDEHDLPDPPEQDELEAVEAEIAAARDRDVWPRHLYFGEV